MEQVVDKPTYINGNILDIVLTNFPICQPVVIEGHSQGLSSDHLILS